MTTAKKTSNDSVSFLDLKVRGIAQRKKILNAIDRVFQSGRFILGPEVEALEKKIADRCHRRFSVGVGSGTDALFLGLKSLGVGPGDEVITTSLSWIATANAIKLTGAIPVFADIGKDLNIDPSSVRRLITSKTRAIVPVHYTGRMCQMDALKTIAKERRLSLVEDASQAFSASYRGRPAGSFGDMGCFSLNPMKILGACGEAGIIVFDSPNLYRRLLSLRYNGTVNREICVEPSINGRLDTIQAAVLLERLPNVRDIVRKRRVVARYYEENLKGVVEFPASREEAPSIYYTFTVFAERRNELKHFLEERGVECRIQHPILMPDQPAYKKGVKGEFSNARRLVEKILCIPAHEHLTLRQMQAVVRQIRAFYGKEDVS